MTTEHSNYSDIQPLLESTNQDGTRLICTFACPVSGKTERATIDIVKANSDSFATKAKSRLRTSAIKSTTRSLNRTLRSVFGNGVIGRLAGELVSDKAKAVGNDGGFDESELERATVAAFDQVQARFQWNAERGGFVHKSAS